MEQSKSANQSLIKMCNHYLRSGTATEVGTCPLFTIIKQNHQGCKRPQSSSGPTISQALPHSLLNHIPKCNIHKPFECFQGWGFHHFPGLSIQMHNCPLSEDFISTKLTHKSNSIFKEYLYSEEFNLHHLLPEHQRFRLTQGFPWAS